MKDSTIYSFTAQELIERHSWSLVFRNIVSDGETLPLQFLQDPHSKQVVYINPDLQSLSEISIQLNELAEIVKVIWSRP